MTTICLNGRLVSEAEATVSVFDHGLLYGDGVFEGIRYYNNRVFKLDEHMRRLWDSAGAIMLDIDQVISREGYAQKLLEACARRGEPDGYIRAVITRGPGDLGLSPTKCPKPHYFIIVGGIQLYPAEKYEHGLKVITCATRRNSPTALDPGIKSLNYLNNILAKIEVNRTGADEGLMLNQAGNVAEATGDNIFVVRDGVLSTPPKAAGILEGVTRQTVIDLALRAGISVREEDMTLRSVYAADECFLTGTAAEVIPVREVDDRKIGNGEPGPLTLKLIGLFKELVRNDGTPFA